MTEALERFTAASLARPVRDEVRGFAERLAQEAGAAAALFYGSNLRTGSLDGVLDFYLLLPGAQRERVWPRIGYREYAAADDTVLRAKTATLSLAQFASAAAGDSRDTTIWTRFAQPCALLWTRDEAARSMVVGAIAEAAQTAAGLAAALGPAEGSWEDYWRALFRATYRAEFRVERPGREAAILHHAPDHFRALLPLAWLAAGLPYEETALGVYRPLLRGDDRRRWLRWWEARRRLGKPLNIARLIKAAGTFDGAADYAAWKVARHSGIALAVTPFRRAHPVLSVPGAAWELWRKRRARPSDRPQL